MSDLISRHEAIAICDRHNGEGYVWAVIRKELQELEAVTECRDCEYFREREDP